MCVCASKATPSNKLRNWATYPAAAKALCLQPRAYSPRYVERLTCFEMDRDMREIRAKEGKAANAKATPQRRQR
jgi:hypothetical protein